jgi:hypothetical protein
MVEFAPDWRRLGTPLKPGGRRRGWPRFRAAAAGFTSARIYDYRTLVQNMLAKPRPSYPYFHCVCPSWDNSPRREEGATVFAGSTPELYGAWLREVIRRSCVGSSQRPGEDAPLVFINAWNEWGEGCHLEPCQRWGSAYLEETRKALFSGAGHA